jgi:peptide/nickel transport system permease protein
MQAYIARRLLSALFGIFGLSILVFLLLRVAPGDAAVMLLGEDVSAQPERLRELRERLGLERPIPLQYADWLANVFRGDLGTSLFSGRNITEELANRLPISLELTLMSMALGLLISMPIGIFAAIYPESLADHILRFLSMIGLAVPNFWLGTMVMVFGARWFGWIPPVGYTSIVTDPVRNLEQFIIPSIIVATSVAASQTRLMRSTMLEVLSNDYIRTARAKGLRERSVVIRHALKNAMIPVLTLFGSQFGQIITGIVIIENIFNLPGLGRFILESIGKRDYPMVQGIILLIGIWVVLLNLLTDLAYGWFDPRIRYR